MPVAALADLVADLAPADDLERPHQDVYRRRKPATPPQHLVSCTVLTDPGDGALFLIDHRLFAFFDEHLCS
jgi:hypothetical protein